MRFGRQNMMSPDELANEFDISESRLADLRIAIRPDACWKVISFLAARTNKLDNQATSISLMSPTQ